MGEREGPVWSDGCMESDKFIFGKYIWTNCLCCCFHIYFKLDGIVVVWCAIPGRYSLLTPSTNNCAPKRRKAGSFNLNFTVQDKISINKCALVLHGIFAMIFHGNRKLVYFVSFELDDILLSYDSAMSDMEH